MKKFKVLFLSLFFLLLWTSQKALAQTEAPIILESALLKAEYGDQIMVKGLVKPNNLVLIYINGKYYGFAKNTTNDPEIDSFSYLSPVIKNNPNHEYKVFAISRNPENFEMSSQTESAVSTIIEPSSLVTANKPKPSVLKPSITTKEVKKEEVVSAPTLITPTGNIGEYKPIISGFSKNQTEVKIFIDNVLETKFWVLDQESGNANFRYTPEKELPRGVHFTYAIATNKNGIESKKSNFLYFYIADPKYLATSTNTSQESPSPVLQKTNEATSSILISEKTKTINSALNISLLVLFIFGVFIWIITLNKQSTTSFAKQKTEEKK
jgi:hypothetical protein